MHSPSRAAIPAERALKSALANGDSRRGKQAGLRAHDLSNRGDVPPGGWSKDEHASRPPEAPDEVATYILPAVSNARPSASLVICVSNHCFFRCRRDRLHSACRRPRRPVPAGLLAVRLLDDCAGIGEPLSAVACVIRQLIEKRVHGARCQLSTHDTIEETAGSSCRRLVRTFEHQFRCVTNRLKGERRTERWKTTPSRAPR